MNELLRKLGAILARLSPREQRLLAILGTIVAAVVAYSLVIQPLTAGRRRIEAEIASLRRDLAEMKILAGQIRVAQSGATARKPGAEKDAKNFSLFSFMDKATAAAVSAESVASMNPSRRELEDGTLESTVEIKLSQVSLAEIVALLKRIENAERPIDVRRLDMKKRYDDRDRFDLVLLAATLSKT